MYNDHISPAEKWLQFRGHLENISQNLFIGELTMHLLKNAGEGINQLDNSVMSLPDIAKSYHEEGINWIAVGDEIMVKVHQGNMQQWNQGLEDVRLFW